MRMFKILKHEMMSSGNEVLFRISTLIRGIPERIFKTNLYLLKQMESCQCFCSLPNHVNLKFVQYLVFFV